MMPLRICILWVFSTLFVLSISNAQEKNYRFLHLDVNEGLSQGSVFAIEQDHLGFMWIGTRDGLNKYDARKFTIYRSNPQDSLSLEHNFIQAITQDRKQRLWVGTTGGLNLYNRNADNFTRIPLPVVESTSGKIEVNVHQIFQDSNGVIWIATNVGLYRIKEGAHLEAELVFNEITVEGSNGRSYFRNFRTIYEDGKKRLWFCTDDAIVLMQSASKDGNRLKVLRTYFNQKGLVNKVNQRFQAVLEFAPGVFWVGTKYNGIKIINENTGEVSSLNTDDSPTVNLANQDVRSLKKADDGSIWIGTFNGLYLYRNGKILFIQADDNNPNSLSNNSIRPIFQDKRGSIWIGTYFGGINIYDKDIPNFQNFTHQSRRNSLSYNVVSAFLENPNGDLVIGTEGGGLNYFNRYSNSFFNERHDKSSAGSLSHNNVKSICRDREGNLWVGTYDGGLNLRRKGQQVYEHFRFDPNNINGLANNNVYALLEDRQGDIWIGTFGGGLQVQRKNQKTGYFQTFNVAGKQLSSNMVRALMEDSKGNLWIGTSNGLNLKIAGTDKFISFLNRKNDSLSISGNDIISIHEDRKGQIWIGTYMGGLNRYLPEKKAFKRFNEQNGLPVNNVFGILSDQKNKLWLSTNTGITCFDPQAGTVRSYTKVDGLPGNEYIQNAATVLRDGKFAFGSFSGFTLFNPDSLSVNSYVPPIQFTDLKLFNRTVRPGIDGVIPKDISMMDELVLDHNQNVFSLEFSVLNYVHPEKNSYAYYLKGFDQEWNFVSNPVATYTNLDPGNYELWIKGSNNDGIWNEKARVLKIRILPAPWKTWWAYTGYFLILGFVVFLIIRFFHGRNKLKRDLLIRKIASEKQEELHEAKLNFFTNISHEFRTPLSLIIGPLNQLKTDHSLSDYAQEHLGYATRNANRLMNLVNQLLDFRKHEGGKMELHSQKVLVSEYLKNVLLNFHFIAEKNNIQFFLDNNISTDYQAYFDPEQFEKVLVNLIYNAFKFTDKGGRIKVQVELEGNDDAAKLLVSVWDSGRGIPAKDIPFVFEQFYQANTEGFVATSSGIGLALSRSIIQLHGGILTVESNMAAEPLAYNTVFRISLPQQNLPTDPSSTAYIFRESAIDAIPEQAEQLVEEHEHTPVEIDRTTDEKPIILVAEDNVELRCFLCENLRKKYVVLEANDGNEALALIHEQQPDIIISDVTMPNCDGITLLQQVKNDNSTNHIPVILLTARTADPYITEAFEVGTDDYITKPFSMPHLIQKISNIIQTRKRLEEKFVQNYLLGGQATETTERTRFLDQVLRIVEENLGCEDFGVQELTQAIGVSRSVLYRKIKQQTGLNLVEFINMVRLKKAAQILLSDSELSISEVAYQVGFNDPKYFSKTFKKFYKESPRTYIEKFSVKNN
ncbi:two-component regulator propeller domain-containing protein [Sphingobacterium sp. CZ-UAM]|jgi:ligand-binding sensor domain-containing protein/signal transduction histidine kinase/DNA-binding NarL/FixJ family response regulator|uniref:hybrid sensor histidine kinase/response regulator transcription factor n=1 Tax=Sphingobacterium sp. CZ-UAM TaxID=1933868 RepID=UPI000986D02F|nr:two-component regulator propeller domain-containing protein [Sphingobacterium sp. CZ-UAM]